MKHGVIHRANGTTSNILRVHLENSSVTTGAGLTGLTHSSSGLIVSTIADNEATATNYTQAASTLETITTLGTFAAPTATKARFKEVDATNQPGVYEIQIADARFAVASAKGLHILIHGATNLKPLSLTVDLLAGQAGGPVACTSANVLPSGAINRSSFAADTGLQSVRSNTAQTGASGSITLDASASATDDIYNDHWVYATGGTGSGQCRLITDYVGSTKVASVSPNWTTTPDNTTTFAILPRSQRLAAAALDSIVIETGVNARQAIAVIGSKLAGKRSGMATATNVYKGLDNTTTRITETTDSDGNASAVTLSLPS